MAPARSEKRWKYAEVVFPIDQFSKEWASKRYNYVYDPRKMSVTKDCIVVVKTSHGYRTAKVVNTSSNRSYMRRMKGIVSLIPCAYMDDKYIVKEHLESILEPVMPQEDLLLEIENLEAQIQSLKRRVMCSKGYV